MTTTSEPGNINECGYHISDLTDFANPTSAPVELKGSDGRPDRVSTHPTCFTSVEIPGSQGTLMRFNCV